MLKDQKALLEQVQAAAAGALQIYNGGAKIGGVVRQLREAASELGARVRFIERESQPKPVKPKVAKPEAAKETT